ncbi:exodeoxyribonuclease VII large subunit [Ferrimonas sediminicola]|uniref:Exodeoxyribonuclease 7 large subunit n=1 Tax=Ferrimonas sediminicola TaxID=2569538 RepID=A0A4U1BK21_9GAMM|nr:exodeoxyribonuclease VII large subunit [Ferrimonas sediminicola]TKB51562.1 exodeoxyribonuclease VII large subunit [Ferrimonas sediminicola]
MSNQVLTVSALNRQLKAVLEQQWGRVWLTGEISNLATPSSGHWYFTLKDERSQLRCAMFRGRNSRVTFRPRDGMQVLVRAQVTLYEPRGDMQLLVDSMQPAGDGLLQQQFEELKLRLAAEGLFASAAKQPLPDPITTLGIITSASGAAIHDVLTVLKRRNPALKVILYPSQVQGREAIASLCRAIETANGRDEVDCLLLTRGGGSLEDLWCFNEEAVARAVFASRLPVVSAVGHEVDITIADFVADLRAPTPSSAAEMLSGDQRHQRQAIANLNHRLHHAIDRTLQQQRNRLTLLDSRLAAAHPNRQLATLSQRLDEQQLRLHRAMSQRLNQDSRQLDNLATRLTAWQPRRQVRQRQQQLAGLSQRLQRSIDAVTERKSQQLAAQAQALNAISPLAVLGRGYAILQDDSGRALTDAGQVAVGERLRARLHHGGLTLTVAATHPDRE